MIAIASAVIAPCMIAVIAVAKRCDSALFFFTRLAMFLMMMMMMMMMRHSRYDSDCKRCDSAMHDRCDSGCKAL